MDSTAKKIIEVGAYKVDENKNLYKMKGSEYFLIQKLKKDIYKMIEYEGNVYFMDTFGDCFIIDETPKFIFGILSQPAYFSIKNNRIYSFDKYSRVWIHDLEGEILNMAFLKENLININIRADYCSVTTDGELAIIDYHNSEIKERQEKKILIFDRSFELLRSQRIESVVEYEDSKVLVIVDGKEQEFTLNDHISRKSLKLENL